jgi:hypothetical protein
LVSSNKVLYPDAFNGFKCDVVCTYRRGGFECDLVMREQPPSPHAYGLGDTGSTLQLFTEFFDTPEPQQIATADDPNYGISDSTLKFGKMTMTRGKAFIVGQQTTNAVAVYKSWFHADGRTFLVEQVPLNYIADDLQTLPLSTNILTAQITKDPVLYVAQAKRQFPPAREVIKYTNQLLVASIDLSKQQGVVLDYNEINTDQTDFTFEAETTYYISGGVILSGTTTIQGGAVIKFSDALDGGTYNYDPSYGIGNGVLSCDQINCETDPYHPAVFTSMNDDSVGETISGSSGSPSTLSITFLAETASYWYNSIAFKNLRFYYANVAVLESDFNAPTFENCQFLSCNIGFAGYGVLLTLKNCLFAGGTGIQDPESGDGYVLENVTMVNANYNLDIPEVDGSLFPSWIYYGEGTIFNITNSLFAGGQSLSSLESTLSGLGATINDSSNADMSGDFQSGADGNYYLAPDSPHIDAGNTTADKLGLYYFTTQTNQTVEGISTVDLGYHYPAVDTNGNPVSTLVTGVPDYLADANGNGLPDAWEMNYFGNLDQFATGDYDGDGTNILAEYQNGVDPNKITFSFSVANQYVSTNVVTGVITIFGGVPSSIAVLVDSTNFAGATWTSYTSSNVTVNLGTNEGLHDVWIGLRGRLTTSQQTWNETSLVLDSASPSISITNPANNASFNVSRVNVRGNFTAVSLKQISVNGVLAFANGTNFDALNVPLDVGTNTITAIVEDLTGLTNTSSITIIATTNAAGIMVDPVQLTADPVGGFTPLQVTFTVQTNLPGTIQQVLYDFNGDDVIDFTTNNLQSITHTYTNGQYFPAITIQTTAGWFSSSGGWNSSDPNRVRINVQAAAVVLSTISITDPVDIQWMATSNLYVLSGSTATITEFDTNNNIVRSLSGIGSNPSGLGVDTLGNVYVAVTSSNQVWKFKPTTSSFIADTNFGIAGHIGLTNRSTGTNNGEFNAPFDAAVSPDGNGISVSDSGNHRIQQFDTNGIFTGSFGGQGTNIGQFITPKGLTYDSFGTLYIADAGNSRIAVAQGSAVVGVSGTNGTALGQFITPANISVGERGIYVADTGNNRIQSFNPLGNGIYSFAPSDIRFAVSTNLNQPAAVAAVDSLTNETFYVADTGNNRVVLYRIPSDDPTPVWNYMTNCIAAGNISGAVSSFCNDTADGYRQSFLVIGTASLISDINQIGALTPVFIRNDAAEYYFEKNIEGHAILFPVEFMKENGVWKIISF